MKGGGLKDLEKRLRDEPENLGLRVAVAGALREAGRVAEAVELYRSVAFAYRDQGRTLQAIAVCRSILLIAPDDARCRALLAELEAPPVAPPAPAIPRAPAASEPRIPRRPEMLITHISSTSQLDQTPLPGALPYHIADPTGSIDKVEPVMPTRPSSQIDTLPGPPMRSGAAEDISEELETRQRPRISSAEIARLGVPGALEDDTDENPAATARVPRMDFDDPPTPPPLPPPRAMSSNDAIPIRGDTEDELTKPRDALAPNPSSIDPLATTFFSHVPVARRAVALSRFHRRAVTAGETVIARDARGPFVLVVGGELEARVDQRTPHRVGAGEYIGESAMLSRAPSPATVVAVVDSEVLTLLPADFYEIVSAFPALWAELKATADRRSK